MACIDPSSNSEVWFDQKQTIEPIMVDFLTLIEPKTESNGPVAAIENTASSQQSTAERLKFLVPTSASGTYKKSKSTARRAPSSISPSNSSNNLSFAFGGGSQSFANSSSTATTTTESLVSAMAVYLDGQVSVEKRGWFGSVWQPHYLSLKKSKLYIFSDHDSESPIYYISLSAVKKIEGFEVSKDASNPNPNAFKLGFGIESLEQTWRFKTSTYMERENWISTLTKAMNNAKGELVVESSLSHHQQQKSSISQHLEPPSTAMKPVASPNSNNSNKPPSSPTNPTIASNSKAQVSATSSSSSSFRVKGNREGAILFGEMKCMSSSEAFSKSRGKWSKHIVVLDEDGLVHIYTDDFKEFTLGKPPIESINVSNAISVRLSNLTSRHNPPLSSETIDASITNVFQINTSKRVVFFQARSAFESANWVLEIQRIVTAKELSPANEFIGRDVMEGSIIDLRSSSNVSLTNTLTGAPEGTNFWLTVIDGAFYYFLSNLSTNPILVIGASQFEEILIPQDLNYSDLITTDGGGDEDNDDASVHHHHRKSISRKRISSVSAPPPLSSLFFEVAFSSGKRFRHHVNSLSERNHWIQRLIKVRMDSFDLFAKVGITSDQVLKEEVTRAKGDVLLEADMKSNIQYLDEKKLEKGEQLALIATLGKVRLSILLVEPTWKSLRSDGCYVLDNGE